MKVSETKTRKREAIAVYRLPSFSLRSPKAAHATVIANIARSATPSHIRANSAFAIDLFLSLASLNLRVLRR